MIYDYIENTNLEKISELFVHSIQEDYRSKWTDYDSLFKFLKENYNVPTKKS